MQPQPKETIMNLKSKLSARATAVVKFIDDTHCIFSDEVSPSHLKCLQILEAPTKAELWDKCKALAIEHAAPTRFKPVVLVITPTDELKRIELKPAVQPDDEYAA